MILAQSWCMGKASRTIQPIRIIDPSFCYSIAAVKMPHPQKLEKPPVQLQPMEMASLRAPRMRSWRSRLFDLKRERLHRELLN
ncbi:hypothetical protein D3C74_279540 [compost metagenome]